MSLSQHLASSLRAWASRRLAVARGAQSTRRRGPAARPFSPMETLEPRCLMAADLVISEFMASNDDFLVDQDGDYSDWIEIHNEGLAPVDLEGWSLTDDADDPVKWVFPAITLAPDAYLLVFASGKDRAVPGSELHANFQLQAEGEYLGLIEPDGFTIASDFAPIFPPQQRNISYGIHTQTLDVQQVSPSDDSRLLIPTDGSLGDSWHGAALHEPFDDSGWIASPAAIGFYTSATSPTPPPPFTPAAETILLQLDFNSTTSLESGAQDLQPGFTPFTLANNGQSVDGRRITLTGLGGALGGRDRDTPLPMPPAFTQDQLYDDLILGLGVNPGNGMRVRIENLLPNTDYHLTLWSFDSKIGGSPKSNWANTADPLNPQVIQNNYSFNNANLPTANDQYTMTAIVRTSAIGDLLIDGTNVASGVSVILNGLRLARLDYTPVIQNDIQTAMQGVNASVFTRHTFDLADTQGIDRLRLHMKYDDGFVAWLNGVEVARRNAPAGAPAYNAAASEAHPNSLALVEEQIVLDSFIPLLRPGVNVLAIQGMNASASDGDFLLVPRLETSTILLRENRYFSQPTPGAPNSQGFIDFLEQPLFSVDHGFFTSSFPLELSTTSADAQIRYTLDGSAPTLASPLYTGPLTISDFSMIRAATFRADYQTSRVNTRTYIFLADVLVQDGAGFPTTWGSYEGVVYIADYQMDPDIVNSPIYGPQMISSLMHLPSLSIVIDQDDMFGPQGIHTNPKLEGIEWERPTSIEWIDPTGGPNFQINAGIRIQGNHTRSVNTKHSFRLEFRQDYDAGKLEFPLFEGNDAPEFDSLILRGGNQDTWPAGSRQSQYIRDQFGRQAIQDMGQLTADGTWAHVYIDGLYWGVYNVTERLDASFMATHLGGDPEDYDVLNEGRVVDGDDDAWVELLDRVADGAQTPEKYASIRQYLDVENLADYIIYNQFVGNAGWDASDDGRYPVNWRAARLRADGEGWRFYVWDTESTLRDLIEDRSTRFYTGNPTGIHGVLLNNPEYRQLFSDRLHKHFYNDGALTDQKMLERWLPLMQYVEPALISESARWGDFNPNRADNPYTIANDYRTEQIRVLKTYLPQRREIFLDQMRALGLLIEEPAAPVFSRHGGIYNPGFALAITPPGDHYQGDGFLHDGDQGKGEKSITFTPDLPAAGEYLVSVRRSDYLGINASAVPVSITHPGGTQNFVIDQSVAGQDWILLGQFTLPAGAGTSVTLSTAGTSGFVIADAVRFDPVVADVIVDNQGPGFSTTGVWNETGHIDEYLGSAVRSSSVGATATWTPTLPGPGMYDVYIWWSRAFSPLTGEDLDSSADYTLMHNGVAHPILLDQDSTSGQWVHVGAYDFAAGGGEFLRLIHDGDIPTTRFSVADAVRFIKKDVIVDNRDPGALVIGDWTRSTFPVHIWYTTDGSDPRLEGGGVNPAASLFNADLPLTGSLYVSARVKSGGDWSALTRATFVSSITPRLIISELMYNPPEPTPAEIAAGFTDNDLFEYIELMNVGDQPFGLAGLSFTRGITFDLSTSAIPTLAPGQRVILAHHPAAFAFRYGAGLPVAGYYLNTTLSNNGENLEISDLFGQPLFTLDYDDEGNWPERADRGGSSLELIDPAAAPLTQPALDDYINDSDSWRSSIDYWGSPGVAGAAPQLSIIINEILAHTDVPGQLDAIELHNTTASPVDLSGWWLTDSQNPYTKFQLPAGSIIQPHGYLVFDESHFNPNGPWNPAAGAPGPGEFALDGSHGESLWLLAGAVGDPRPTLFIDKVSFDASENGVSLGRIPNGDPLAGLYPNRQVTLGGANSAHRLSPVVISQIMYHPPGGQDMLEYLEIHNRSHLPVDLTGWRLADGIDFEFPFGRIILPHTSLVVLRFDPAEPLNQPLIDAFEAYYGITMDARFIGHYFGALNNDGERLKLQRPDSPPAGEPDYIPMPTVDEVRYDDNFPWPQTPDGPGDALHRYTPAHFADHFTSWRGQTPTPGRTRGDVNGDGRISAGDIDILQQMVNADPPITAGSITIYEDLNGDEALTQADVDLLIFSILSTLYGDANIDGQVSIGDLTLMAGAFGLQGGWADGDFNGDGQVSIGDLTLLAEVFGQVADPFTGSDAPAAQSQQNSSQQQSAAPAPLMGLQALGDPQADSDDKESDDEPLADILSDLAGGLR